MSFGASIPKDKSLAGLDSSKIPTNEQGVALTYFAGVARLAPTWLGPAYNQVSKKVDSGGSKMGGSSSESSYEYYGDCAGVFCLGPVDGLKEIWYSNRKIWEGDVQRGNTDSATITTKRGVVTLYWGTETQPIDPTLAPFNWPAYRGQCYAVFRRLSFGQSSDSAPQIEFVLVRYPNTANLATQPNINNDANPIHPQIELLTNPRFGAGWDVSTLDLVSADAVANQLKYETLGVSPVITREQDARTTINSFADYHDGYLVADPTNGGKLTFGLRRPFTADPSTLPLLGEYELIERPNLQPQSWRDVPNELIINYTDSQNDYQTNGITFVQRDARAVVGEPLPQTMDRSWITTKVGAGIYAAYVAQISGLPKVNANELKVRKEAALTIKVGDFVRLTYADYLITIIMRVERRKTEADRAQVVEFDLVADGYFAEITPYVADHPPRPPAVIAQPQTPLYSRMIELPWPLASNTLDRQAPQLVPLVARASALGVRLRVYSSDDNTTYSQVARTGAFAVYGTLAANYGLTSLLDDSAGGMLIDLPGPDGSDALGTTDETGRLTMMLLIFCEDEILSYRDVQIVSPTRVRLIGLRRVCYDTLAATHALETPVLIVAADDLRAFTNASYAKNAEVFLKPVTGFPGAVLDLSDSPVIELMLINRTARPLAPLNLRVNHSSDNPTFQAGADVLIEWDAASWRRHAFWDSWEEPYTDPKLTHKLRIVDANGTLYRKVSIDSGVSSYTCCW